MPRRRCLDPDPVINDYLLKQHRAQTTALTALALLLAWIACATIAGTQGLQPAFAALPRLFATVLGWGAVIVGAVALARCAKVYLYPPWRDR
jgi:hypothetical protein